jgi:hypothetical protein
VVTVSLELSGAEASRSYIEAAVPQHPSLVDAEHRVDSLFGVVNVPSVVWIDEQGVIVRPPEPGWPGTERRVPPGFFESLPRLGRAAGSPQRTPRSVGYAAALASGQSRTTYADAVRDWVAHGAVSPYALDPAEVVARSQPRPGSVSAAAAHFELAERLWQTGLREQAIAHFNACHRLQPDNWTYKRQAYSLVAAERGGSAAARFAQGPLEGEEADWPFAADFRSEVEALGEGEYYPRTL